PQWRRTRIRSIGFVGVVIAEPLHECGGEYVALAVLGIRTTRHVEIGDGGHQALADDCRTAGVARELAHDRGDVATRAPTEDRELTGDSSKRDRVVGDPSRRRES